MNYAASRSEASVADEVFNLRSANVFLEQKLARLDAAGATTAADVSRLHDELEQAKKLLQERDEDVRSYEKSMAELEAERNQMRASLAAAAERAATAAASLERERTCSAAAAADAAQRARLQLELNVLAASLAEVETSDGDKARALAYLAADTQHVAATQLKLAEGQQRVARLEATITELNEQLGERTRLHHEESQQLALGRERCLNLEAEVGTLQVRLAASDEAAAEARSSMAAALESAKAAQETAAAKSIDAARLEVGLAKLEARLAVETQEATRSSRAEVAALEERQLALSRELELARQHAETARVGERAVASTLERLKASHKDVEDRAQQALTEAESLRAALTASHALASSRVHEAKSCHSRELAEARASFDSEKLRARQLELEVDNANASLVKAEAEVRRLARCERQASTLQAKCGQLEGELQRKQDALQRIVQRRRGSIAAAVVATPDGLTSGESARSVPSPPPPPSDEPAPPSEQAIRASGLETPRPDFYVYEEKENPQQPNRAVGRPAGAAKAAMNRKSRVVPSRYALPQKKPAAPLNAHYLLR